MLSSSQRTKQRKRSHFVCVLTVSILIFQFVKIYLLHILAFQLPSFVLHSCCLRCSVLSSANNRSNGVQTPAVAGGSARLIFNGYGRSCPLS